jgi:hypothetical protein
MGVKAERKCVDEIDPTGVAGCYITDSRTKTMLLITNTWNYRVIFLSAHEICWRKIRF